MRIKIIFDKDSLDKNFRTGWGVSFLINGKILFDTGEKGEWLIENMRVLKVEIEKIEAIVISHDHWDHTGGLWELLKKKKGLKVYICPNFSKGFKEKARQLQAELIEAGKFTEISKNIFITGEIAGAYHDRYMPEQAVVLQTENGITVITGCAHPGILKMTEKVKEKFSGERIFLVLGGFHLMESDNRAIEIVAENFKKMGVKKAGPMHCSGREAEDIFKKYYGKECISIKAGQEIEV